ncbi:polyphenol oxidase family protein [Campylobacter sp. MIT 21-1685]|uniref:polyphenol oxidase family protein n=1 Tax=unclassified Campylobacter TaxID=2593542 RepID=UPI00224AF929|nr:MULTISPECIES: polyphenol oxidase family protein [unclassified Campylobacter]MCX2682536.1 polyphenol oxidase family protein [Campylobacter sp. MIT 21-1684]MCX2750751.1 polyphenol oxidase family protein [Campylobacter sp. MIT 21-1682]MCX2807017.1 polyphenol oxidase family protein [Campylobacter sp. MIT 21-1685]
MGRCGENFISVLDNDDISVFCAFDKDYNIFRAKAHKENVFAHLGFESIDTCVFMNQIHSNYVQIYNHNTENFSCDGLITSYRNLALCVLSADCLPLLLWHKSGIIAALHSGREGSFGNILGVCVEAICEKNPHLNTDGFHLFIMPGICGRDYEIDGEILDFAKIYFSQFLNKKRLDLKALVKSQAQDLGIQKITDLGICTYEDKKFYSYRLDKNPKRFASVIVLKEK